MARMSRMGRLHESAADAQVDCRSVGPGFNPSPARWQKSAQHRPIKPEPAPATEEKRRDAGAEEEGRSRLGGGLNLDVEAAGGGANELLLLVQIDSAD